MNFLRKVHKRLLGGLLVIFFGAAGNFQVDGQTASVSGDSLDAWSWKSLQLTPALSLTFGGVSNTAPVQNEFSGAYGGVNPSLLLDFTPRSDLALNLETSANLKEYTEEEGGKRANERSLDFRGIVIGFLSDHWEIGGEAGTNFSQKRFPEKSGAVQKYVESDARAYVAGYLGSFSLEVGGGGKSRDYSTPTFERGNSFENDLRQISGDLRLRFEFSDHLNSSLIALVENRLYRERMAEFTDGAAADAFNPHPTLKETSIEYGPEVEYHLGGAIFTTLPRMRFNKDRVYGARDSLTLKVEQKATVPLFKKLIWTPAFVVSQEKFKRFRSDPDGDPSGSPLRKDLEFKLTSLLKYLLSENWEIHLDYGYSSKDSTFEPGSYAEQTGSVGLNVAL